MFFFIFSPFLNTNVTRKALRDYHKSYGVTKPMSCWMMARVSNHDPRNKFSHPRLRKNGTAIG